MDGWDLIAVVAIVAGVIAVGIGLAMPSGSNNVSSKEVKDGITIAGTIAAIFGVVLTLYQLVQ